MAEVSRGRGIFGRLLAGIGLVWVFWGFFGSVIGQQFGNDLANLPILPGIVIFFLGRALARRPRKEPSAQREVPTETRAPRRPGAQVRPSPVRHQTRPEASLAPEPAGVSEVIDETFEAPEPRMSMLDGHFTRKTSAEMVAEARERYGKRP